MYSPGTWQMIHETARTKSVGWQSCCEPILPLHPAARVEVTWQSSEHRHEWALLQGWREWTLPHNHWVTPVTWQQSGKKMCLQNFSKCTSSQENSLTSHSHFQYCCKVPMFLGRTEACFSSLLMERGDRTWVRTRLDLLNHFAQELILGPKRANCLVCKPSASMISPLTPLLKVSTTSQQC